MIEMHIEGVRVSLTNYQRVVILKETISNRYLPIWIGPAEADAIAVHLQEIPVARPLTHDLLSSVISTLGGTVKSVIVNDLNNDTFYARILVDVDGRHIEIDSRPSDAIALAVRVSVPIFVEESVLDKAGVLWDPETGKAQIGAEDKAGERGENPPSEEELKRLSAFTDFIDTLDLEDFDKRRR